MKPPLQVSRQWLGAAAAALVLIGAAIGFGASRLASDDTQETAPQEPGRRILYWYDPMVPDQHFERPGKSPFMDMELVPKYAEETGTAQPEIAIDSALVQQLGMRLATVRRGTIGQAVTASGTVEFNQRDIAIVQARATGFVQRVYGRAPGDVINAGAPLADIFVPEWTGGQTEFLAVRRIGDRALTSAARQRLALLGMPPGTIEAVERSGRPRSIFTATSPAAGTIKALNVRSGMTVAVGQTLAEINGLATVWLNAAVPEAMAGRVRAGMLALATFAALPGMQISGRVAAILPEAEIASRTITVRIELPNRDGKLRPGMFANVSFDGGQRPVLFVPTEAVIRTGRRTLVMLAKPGGRFQPAEVRTGIESGATTEILEGLAEGERIVASGQFLLDSEASLTAIEARPMGAAPAGQRPEAMQPGRLLETVGRIETISRDAVTISHDPVPAIRWPAMTMTFRVLDSSLVRGFTRGDRIRFQFDQPTEGPTLRRMVREPPR